MSIPQTELRLQEMLAESGGSNASVFYAKLLTQGYSESQILTDNSIPREGYKSLVTVRTDGRKIYRWIVTGDYSTMSKTNERDSANVKRILNKMMNAAKTIFDRQLIQDRLRELELFVKSLSPTVQDKVQTRFSKDLVIDAPQFKGLYAYTFKVWLDHPDGPASDQFRMKIGAAWRESGGVQARLKDQVKAAKTSMPQPLLPLRAYEFEDGRTKIEAAEKALQRELETRSMGNPDMKRLETGIEWYSTRLQVIDQLIPTLPHYRRKVELYNPTMRP